MEDGSRLQDSFSCGQNMWDLLTHFPQIRVSELSDSGSTPVCVYMRDEVSGKEALKRATLKSLGLTGGSAIVRFLVKKTKTPEVGDDGEAVETAAMTTKPVAQEITPHPPSPADPPSQPETPAVEVPIKHSSPDRLVETPPAPASATATTTTTNTLPVKQEGEGVPNPQNAVRPKACPIREMKQEEDGEKAGPSRLSSSHLPSSSSPPSAAFIPFSGGGQRLGGPGTGGAGPSPSSSSSLISLAAAGGSPKAKKAKPNHDVNSKCEAGANQGDLNEREEFLQPVEREPLIYHLDSGARRHDDGQDMPDEFFEVTMDDVRKRFAQLKSER